MAVSFQSPVPILSENLFPVVGVGASAGGLDAFMQLVKAIPPDSRMAWILVQHLSPTQESLLPGLLQKYTSLPVQEITDSVEVAPGHIYTIPSNKVMTANDGVLQLFDRPDGERTQTIDVFLTSLAEIHREQAIGVLLSGTGRDGTVGLKMIRDVGGITVVQDKESATYYDMPQSALDAEVVSLVLAPAAIPGGLAAIVQTAPATSGGNTSDNKKPDESFRQIVALLRARTGTDFTYYKQTTIRRRILRRLALHRLDNVADYLNLLIESKAEQEALYRDILIPVTSFFRDPLAFDIFSSQLLPQLLQRKTPDDQVRIWIAGCSSGEEAYSVAISVHEYFQEEMPPGKVQIFATDLSESAISQARVGKYPKKSLAGLSPDRIQKFFTRLDGHYHINKPIREMCVFAVQNFLKDPPFSRVDLVSCRNVLIYLEAPLQKRALTTFHYSLNSGGYLLLGPSEGTAPAAELFHAVSGPSKLFVRRDVHSTFLLPVATRAERSNAALTNQPVFRKVDELTQVTNQALPDLQPVHGVVVDQHGDIVQFRGSTGPYLEPAPGKVNYQLLRMARDGLAFELRTLLHKAKLKTEPVSKSSIPLDNGARSVDLLVIPLQYPEEQYFFVRFQESVALSREPVESSIPQTSSAPEISLLQARVEHLERELAQARADMHVITEDLEATNKELQSANEELLSGSEELQSINEELQTTKEEVQSTNEELMVLNQELLSRNDQLVDARKYAEAILNTVHEPLMVLTGDLRVRSVNPAFYEWFGGGSVEGQLLAELDNAHWNLHELQEKLGAVLPAHSAFENLKVTWAHGPKPLSLLVNARQIVRESSKEALILLAMQDITLERQAEELQRSFGQEMERQVIQRTSELQEANVNLEQSNRHLGQFVSIASHDLQEPLRKIKTFTSILSRQFAVELSDPAQQVITRITRSADRMSQLISEVLAYSKVLHARESFVQTDLHEIMRNVLEDLDLLITETGAVITYDLPVPVISANPLLINQLFYNLLCNALKFFEQPNFPHITITRDWVSEDFLMEESGQRTTRQMLQIVVADEGIGFRQQYARQIFGLFERLHGDDEFQGTGIGLALCKQIVEHHHGFLFARSEEGKGARFHVLLPLTQD